MSELKPETVQAFLQKNSTLALATVSPSGRVTAASLFFASDPQLRLYWTSGSHSRHSQNLNHHSQAAVAVHGAYWTWDEIQGVQMEGSVAIVPAGPGWSSVWDLYLAKFPMARDFQAEIYRANFYCFTPRWVRLIDNGQGFGYKQELVPEPAGE